MGRALRLVTPAPDWLPAFLELAQEFHAHSEPRYADALRDPEAYLRRRAQYAAGVDLPADHVPETTFWLVAGEGEPTGPAPQILAVRIVDLIRPKGCAGLLAGRRSLAARLGGRELGVIKSTFLSGLRHYLTPQLTEVGGHIGYAVRPSARRQGIGTALLGLTLIEARKLGLARVLVTCDVTNTGSARIIQRNGGVLEDERSVPDHPEPVARYWIDLEGA